MYPRKRPFRAPRASKDPRHRTVLLSLTDAEKAMLEAIATEYGTPLVVSLRTMIHDTFQSLKPRMGTGAGTADGSPRGQE